MNKMLSELGINAKEAENTMRTITTDQKNQVLAAVAESSGRIDRQITGSECSRCGECEAEPHAGRSGRSSSYVEPGENRRHGRRTQTASGA